MPKIQNVEYVEKVWKKSPKCCGTLWGICENGCGCVFRFFERAISLIHSEFLDFVVEGLAFDAN